jgi:hypothetical protein
MGFLNYNKIFHFDIDILNLETGCNKICDDFENGGQFEMDVGLFYLIDTVKGKEISIFLQIKKICLYMYLANSSWH